MEKNLRILYLKDPSSGIKQDIYQLDDEYDVRTVLAQHELTSTLKGFKPHILLCSTESSISAQEVLDVLDISRENALILISVKGGNLKEVLPLLESSSMHLKKREAQKINEEERKELEEQYKSIYQTSLDGILVVKPDGEILAANPAACKMLEMTEQEICHAGRSGIVDPEDTRLAYAVSDREKVGKANTELTLIKKSGLKFPVELTSSVFKDAKGNFKITVILRDVSERKKVEEQLRISHESYKTIFYHSPIPYWIYDEETCEIVDVNEVALKNYGYSRDEFLKLNLLDLRPQEDITDLERRHNNNCSPCGVVRYGKCKHLKKDKSTLIVEVFGYSFKFGSQNCKLVACIDVTDKEDALGRLEQKSTRLAAAQEIAKIGYWELNVASEDLFLSNMTYRIWGFEKLTDHPTWSSFKKSVHPEDLNKFIKVQRDSLIKGGKHNVEYRIILPTGEIKWIYERGRVLTWKDDKPETVERTVQDVTVQRIYLENLSTSEARYKGIVKSHTNYIIRTDMMGNYTYYNEKFYSDFSWVYGEEEILGQSSMTSIMEYHHQAVIDLVQRCILAPGLALQLEIDKPKKKGGVRTTLWDFVCLVNAQGDPTEIQCVGVDITARVKAEKQLNESKLRYQLVSESTSDAIWDWDLTTGNVFWGKTFKTMFGYNPEDYNTIEAWTHCIHNDDVGRVTKSLFAAMEGTGKKWVCEYRLRKKNGDYAYVIDKGSILRDQNNTAYRAVGSLQDVTEKKKLEDLLEKANTLSRIGSYELNLNTEELYWSPMTREIHGVGKDFIPELNTAIYFYKRESRERIKKVLRKSIEKKVPFDEELEIVTASGKEIWVRAMGQPEVEQGKCVKVSGSFQDIDKIKRAESEVLKAAQEKETLLESIGDSFFAVDENWTVTYWNKHAADVLTCPKEFILNKSLWDIFPDATGTPFQRNYHATMKDKRKRRFEAFFERTSAWYEVTVYPSNEGLLVFFKDVTERKNNDVKLRELNKSLRAHTRELVTANKGLEQFSYIVSHNLRSPVANILGLADLLQNSIYPHEVKEQFFSEMFSNVERLDAVITDLNGILQAKVDVKAKKEKIDLGALVEEIKLSIQNLIIEEKVKISCRFENIKEVTSVKSYLYSIFYNLIVNSIKYRRPEITPELDIRTKREGEFIMIFFKDNGLGMDLTNKRDQIFNLYKRFHHHIEGKGMGLFMVKTQVEMLGGKITVDSSVNEGTLFTIELKENVMPIQEKNEATLSLSGS